MTVSEQDLADDLQQDFSPYRAICKSAVVSLVLGLASAVALLTPVLLVLPALGIALGIVAWNRLRRYPEELTGRPAAVIGLVLSVLILISGTVMHAVVYATEVPEGYRRITFDDLQPSAEARELPVSPLAMELNGKKVFVKGYVYPDGQRYNIKRFVLVADLGTCCFGGQPKLTHMIQVTLQDPYRVEYSYRKLKLGGTLTVDRRLKPVSGLGGVYFQLDVDYAR